MGKIVQTAGRESLGEFAPEFTDKDRYQNTIFFPVGEPNPYGEFFEGQSYLAPVSEEQVPVFNVTFEPGCKNHWHGAADDSWFSHLAIEVPGEECSTEWCEAVM